MAAIGLSLKRFLISITKKQKEPRYGINTNKKWNEKKEEEEEKKSKIHIYACWVPQTKSAWHHDIKWIIHVQFIHEQNDVIIVPIKCSQHVMKMMIQRSQNSNKVNRIKMKIKCYHHHHHLGKAARMETKGSGWRKQVHLETTRHYSIFSL